jgi:hypothetical protein
MTPDALRAAIKVVDNQIVLTRATLGSDAVDKILAEFGQNDTLTIHPAAIISKPEDDSVLVQGTVGLISAQVAGTVRFYLDGADGQVEVIGALPVGWGLGTSFSSLQKTHLAQLGLGNPKLQLRSKEAAGGARGMTLEAGFTLPAILEALRWFAAPDDKATLSGPIALDGGEPSMTLTVSPGITASLIKPLTIALTMEHQTRTFRKTPDQKVPVVSAISLLLGDLSFTHDGKTVNVPMQAAFNEGIGLLELQLVTGNVFDLALAEIAHWIGGVNLASDGLPSTFRPPAGLTLHDVTFAIGLQTKSIEYVSLSIQSTTDWPVVDKVKVSGIVLDFLVMPGRTPSLSATLTGIIAFDTVAKLEMYAQVPDFLIRGHLAEDSAVDLIPLIAHLGGTSADVESTLKIDVLSFEAHPSGSYYTFDIDVMGEWKIVKGLAIDQLGAHLRYENSALHVTFDGRFVVGGADMSVEAEYDGELGGWLFHGDIGKDKPLQVGRFIENLGKDFSSSAANSLPDFIAELELSHVTVTFDTKTKDFIFKCEIRFPVAGRELDVTLDVVMRHDGADGYTRIFGGALMVGQLRFELYFEKIQPGQGGQASSIFLASLQPDVKIDVRALVADVDATAGELMPALTVDIENALFLYSKTGTDAPTYLFGLALGAELDLASLPLVGPIFHDLNFGGVKDVQVLYVSAPIVAKDVATFNALMTEAQAKPLLPTKPGVADTAQLLTKGFNFAANINLGGSPTPVTAGGNTAPVASAPAPQQAAPAPPSGNASWIDVKRSLGPVTLDRIGVRYENGRAWLLLDADFIIAGLSLSLQGLALGFKLDDLKDVSADLDGMMLDFQSGALTIAGGFLRFGDDYLGMAQVKAGTFGLTAIGGYAPSKKSFFIFVRLDVPLGGPPFFFVTGVAGGFGINRNLIIPPIDELPRFPLLPANSTFPTKLPTDNPGAALSGVLSEAEKFLSPRAGENWAAAGLDFTSFEMVDSSSLVTVSFGVDFEIALLGICRITVPKLDPEPIVYLEIALEARFKPAEGLIAVDGRLTPASFLFAGLCRITGGFAFYIWYAGPHEGDFVVSIGGYHPRFKKPDNYPVVPRLQLGYQIGNLVIKGQSYMALTPHMAMAGLQIDATWSSGPISAWFSAGVDFLLDWRPFHYEADAYIHIGASFTIDLLFTSVSITIHVGVDLSIWGPPFGGKATVDLDIISFTIYFGDGPRTETVDWAGFKKSFLPAGSHSIAATKATRPAAGGPQAMAEVADTDGLLCTALVSDGVLKDLKAKDKTAFFSWVVDMNHFSILSSTLIPAKQANYNAFALQTPFKTDADLKPTGQGPAGTDLPTAAYDKQKYPDGVTWTDQFGVLPMKLDAGGFHSQHSVTLKKAREHADYKDPASYTTDVDAISVEPLVKPSSSALWAPRDPGLNGDRLVANTLIGLRLTPMAQHPDITLKADLWAMLFNQNNDVSSLTSLPAIDRGDTFKAKAEVKDKRNTLSFTLGDKTVTSQDYKLSALTDSTSDRSAVVGSLKDLGFDLPADRIDVADLAQYPLWDWPMIRTLGEEVRPS